MKNQPPDRSEICAICFLEHGGSVRERIPSGSFATYCPERHGAYLQKWKEYDDWVARYQDRMIADAHYGDPTGAELALNRERERLRAKNPHRMFLVEFLLAAS